MQSGDLTLAGGQSTGGTFQLASTASLTFASTYNLDKNSSLNLASSSSQGVVFFSSGNATIGCALNVYQIVVDGGQAILNGTTSVNQLLLSGGTMTGSGVVTVSGDNATFNWTGGTMTSSTGSAGKTRIASGADWFIFGSDAKQASNRTITIDGAPTLTCSRTRR